MSSLDNPRDRAVRVMFDRIAWRYDLLNRLISFRFDNAWRNRAIQEVLANENKLILDLGAGTGDLTFTAARRITGLGRIVGLDFSLQMLKLAQSKQGKVPNGRKTAFIQGSATASPFKDSVFDSVMTAFVLRNVSNLPLFFAHAFRVLKSGGRFVSLDMFPPSRPFFSRVYGLYFYCFVPKIAGWLAHDRPAYKYLAESVEHFDPPERVANLLEQTGFKRVRIRKFLKGAVCMHIAEKLNQA